jgi:hypothetical protein
MRYRASLIAIALGILLAVVPSYAQSKKDAPATGTIHGVVVGLDGKTVANAHIYLQPSGSTSQRVGISDEEGIFTFPHSKPGNYDLKAQAGHRESDWHRNVSLKAGGDANITLKLGASQRPPKPQGQ